MSNLISVGEKYTLFDAAYEAMKNQDGGILEALDGGEGFWYHLYLNKPTGEEKKTFQEEKINVRLIEEEDYLLPMIRFGDTLMIYEMSFDPTIYDDKRAMQIAEENNLLSVILIDSTSNIVEGLRQANLPLRFIQICKDKWEKAYEIKNYSQKYKKWYTKIQRIPVDTLWNRGIYVGKLGESFNLSELQK